MRRRRLLRVAVAAGLVSLCGGLVVPSASHAATAQEIDAAVNAALARFESQVKGADKFIASSKGVLVLPQVVKAAFVFGGQYGEGALRIGGHTVGYYSYGGGSWGASIGIQKKDIIFVFRDAAALKQFQNASGWRVGIDANVTVINVAAGADLSTMQINQPVVAFVNGEKGLMFDVSLNGSKITKITPK